MIWIDASVVVAQVVQIFIIGNVAKIEEIGNSIGQNIVAGATEPENRTTVLGMASTPFPAVNHDVLFNLRPEAFDIGVRQFISHMRILSNRLEPCDGNKGQAQAA